MADSHGMPDISENAAADTSIPAATSSRICSFHIPHLLECNAQWKDRAVRPGTGLMYFSDSRATLGGAGSDINLILVLLRDHGFAPAERLDDSWSLFWHTGDLSASECACMPRLLPHQRWNKLPGATALTVKTELWQTLRAAQRAHRGLYDFVPESYVMPEETAAFEATMREEARHANLWILKPASRQRGTGIFVHRAVEDRTSSGCGWGAGARGGRERRCSRRSASNDA